MKHQPVEHEPAVDRKQGPPQNRQLAQRMMLGIFLQGLEAAGDRDNPFQHGIGCERSMVGAGLAGILRRHIRNIEKRFGIRRPLGITRRREFIIDRGAVADAAQQNLLARLGGRRFGSGNGSLEFSLLGMRQNARRLDSGGGQLFAGPPQIIVGRNIDDRRGNAGRTHIVGADARHRVQQIGGRQLVEVDRLLNSHFLGEGGQERIIKVALHLVRDPTHPPHSE